MDQWSITDEVDATGKLNAILNKLKRLERIGRES